MSEGDVKLRFVFYCSCEVGDLFNYGQDHVCRLQGFRGSCDSTLDKCRVQLGYANAHTIPLPGYLHRFPEHLHGLDLFLNLKRGELDIVTNFNLSREYGTRHDGSLPLDREAVIHRKEEWLIR
jgi:hypothetical protein